MARTVTSWANRSVPAVLRFMSGLPVRAQDWAAVGAAQNLTHATGRHGAQWAMAWKGTGITGAIASGSHDIKIAIPVPDEDLSRLRVRVWGATAPAAMTPGVVDIIAPTAGTVTATTAIGAVARYSSGALDVTADVNTADADAGPYVEMTLRARGEFSSLESVHVDSLERGWGTYPGASTLLPAGITAGVVPIDDGETVQDSPVSADLLADMRSNLGEFAARRQVRACWGDWYNSGTNAPRANGGLAPQRIPVMLPIPQGGVMSLTLAAHVYDAPPTTRTAWLCTLTPGGSVDSIIGRWTIPASTGMAVSTVDIPTARVRGRFDRQCPPTGLHGYLSAVLIVEGAIPQRDRLALEGVRTVLADDDIITGGWGLSSLTLWGP